MITLVLGGARSGKSELAESIAASLPPPVTYIATARGSKDPDWVARIEAHRARRPPEWETVELAGALAPALTAVEGTALVDSLGAWVAGSDRLQVDVEALCSALTGRNGDSVVVSDEVGLSVHPSTESGRLFRDALGEVNRAVSAVADTVLLVVAGRTLVLGPSIDSLPNTDRPEPAGD